ncbi:MAG TPA: hypothetical protein VK809_10265, partial [Bacteroidia bacterium]|nr:hypothetical protein [Bacteroidia bacterium]
ALFSLKIEGSSFSPAIIKAYPADTANQYAITSSINPGTYFSGKGNAMFSKVFRGKSAFMKKEEKAKKGKK